MKCAKNVLEKFNIKNKSFHDLLYRVDDYEAVRNLISSLIDNEDYLSDEVGVWHSKDKNLLIIDLPFAGSPTGMQKMKVEKKFLIEILHYYMNLLDKDSPDEV